MTLPRQSLLICANQRTGSTLLSRALTDTQVAGRPEEYFLTVDPDRYPDMPCWEDGPFGGPGMSRTEYLREVYRLDTTDNGVFAAKMMWNAVDMAVAAFTRVTVSPIWIAVLCFSGPSRARALWSSHDETVSLKPYLGPGPTKSMSGRFRLVRGQLDRPDPWSMTVS